MLKSSRKIHRLLNYRHTSYACVHSFHPKGHRKPGKPPGGNSENCKWESNGCKRTKISTDVLAEKWTTFSEDLV